MQFHSVVVAALIFTGTLFLALISGIQCQQEELFHQYVLDNDTVSNHTYFWSFPPPNVELYFFYHPNLTIKSLEPVTRKYLQDAGVLDLLSTANATGVWSALHENYSPNCTIFPTTSGSTTTGSTTTGSTTPTPEEPSTTIDPCIKVHFPIIEFSSENDDIDFNLEAFYMMYFSSHGNESMGEGSQPQIWLNVTTNVNDNGMKRIDYSIPENCTISTLSNNQWAECTIINFKDRVTKVEIQFVSVYEYDVILVDKIVLNTRGLYIPPTTTTTTKIDIGTSTDSTSDPTTESSPWTTTTDYSGSGWSYSNPTFFNLILFLPMVCISQFIIF